MIVISPTELRSEQKRYLELAEKEQVIIKKGTKLIELVVKERTITDDDIKNSLSLKDVKTQVYKHIDKLFDK
jgi:hypothetical protein